MLHRKQFGGSFNLNLDVVLYARDKVKNDYLLAFPTAQFFAQSLHALVN